jgi:hypothetical protein
MTFRAALAFIMLNAALSGVVWYGYTEADAVELDTISEAKTTAGFSANVRETGSALADSWGTVALARPLFDPRRRPNAGGSQQTAAGLPRLTGVLVGLDERLAFFVDPAGGKPQVVREGDTIGAHVVQSIRPGEAIVAGPRGQHVLHPSFERSGTRMEP